MDLFHIYGELDLLVTFCPCPGVNPGHHAVFTNGHIELGLSPQGLHQLDYRYE